MRVDAFMAGSLSDARLLERFVSDREEAAFVALVRRHGPRVERICRRILRNEQDVEDVFQATFLVLARKAAGIPWRESVSPWLAAVARRLAIHARSGAARQRGRELTVTALLGKSSEQDSRLPECYHPLVEPSGGGRASRVCGASSTTNCCDCPRSTGRRSCSATWKGIPARRPPAGSAGRPDRCRGGSIGAGTCCGAG